MTSSLQPSLSAGVFLGLAIGVAGCAAAPREPASGAIVELSPPAATAAPAPPPLAAEGDAEAGGETPGETDRAEGSEVGVLGLLGPADGSALGSLLGDGSAASGLGLSGPGAGIGSGDPLAPGSKGTGRGLGSGTGPQVQVGATSTTGSLPPEVIRRIVQQHRGTLRACYEKALATTPDLAGKVSVRFVIEKDGSVGRVTDAGSTLPDAAVTSCVLATFQRLSFPMPSGGVVTVVYPILFTSAESAPTAPPAAPPTP